MLIQQIASEPEKSQSNHTTYTHKWILPPYLAKFMNIFFMKYPRILC